MGCPELLSSLSIRSYAPDRAFCFQMNPLNSFNLKSLFLFLYHFTDLNYESERKFAKWHHFPGVQTSLSVINFGKGSRNCLSAVFIITSSYFTQKIGCFEIYSENEVPVAELSSRDTDVIDGSVQHATHASTVGHSSPETHFSIERLAVKLNGMNLLQRRAYMCQCIAVPKQSIRGAPCWNAPNPDTNSRVLQ